jgi:hypothetical protein
VHSSCNAPVFSPEEYRLTGMELLRSAGYLGPGVAACLFGPLSSPVVAASRREIRRVSRSAVAGGRQTAIPPSAAPLSILLLKKDACREWL